MLLGVCLLIFCGHALGDDTVDVQTTFKMDSHDTYKYSSIPGTMELPLSNHPGVGMFNIPENKEAPGYYPLGKLSVFVNAMTLEQARRNMQDPGKDYKSQVVNNILGFSIDPGFLPPGMRIPVYINDPVGYIFVSMAEINNVSKNRFATPVNRAAWIIMQAAASGAKAIKINIEGMDRYIKMLKGDAGAAGARLSTASSMMLASVLNAFVNGGVSTNQWMEPGYLNTFAGRLYSKKELRLMWDYHYGEFLKSGKTVEDFTSQPLYDPNQANDLAGYNEIADLAVMQNYCYNALLQQPDAPPTELMNEEELKGWREGKGWKPSAPGTASGFPMYEHLETGLAVVFDHASTELREDQKAKALEFTAYAAQTGAVVSRSGSVFIIGGHADRSGPEDRNWSLYGAKRAQLLAEYVKIGLRKIVQPDGKPYFTEQEISGMILIYSGGENNPRTDSAEEKNEKERIVHLYVGKRI